MYRLLRTAVFGLSILLVTGILCVSLSSAQEYPANTVQMIVAWPPGGISPILAGLVAEEAKKYLPKPVIVEHKPGAAGTIGAYFASKAPPDGYTLLFARASHMTSAPVVQKVDYVPLEDFETIAQLTSEPIGLAVKNDAPWKTLAELVNYAKKNPEVVTCANPGTYSSHHLNAIRFEQMAGIKFTHVPFKGGGEQMASLAGGHVACAIRAPGEGEPLVDYGKVRILTVFDSARYRFYPNTPTSKEEGYPFEAGSWTGLMAPRGTPKPILKIWEELARKITHDPSFLAKTDKMKISIVFKNGEEFRKIFQHDFQEYSQIVKKLGLKPM